MIPEKSQVFIADNCDLFSRFCHLFVLHCARVNKQSVSYSDQREQPVAARPALVALAVSNQEEDHVALRHIFGHSNWILYSAQTVETAMEFLRKYSIAVVLADRELPDGSWKNILDALPESESAPVLVVTSRSADESLWAEVLNLGGCDVLAKPFDSNEVVWTVSMAWNDWNSRARSREPALV